LQGAIPASKCTQHLCQIDNKPCQAPVLHAIMNFLPSSKMVLIGQLRLKKVAIPHPEHTSPPLHPNFLLVLVLQ
jgi:hypothetical protein